MNTHLHLLEAYTTLHAAWPDALLAQRLRALLELFLDRIIAPEGDHVVGFFTEEWEPRSYEDLVRPRHRDELAARRGGATRSATPRSSRARATPRSRLAAAVLEHGVDVEHRRRVRRGDGRRRRHRQGMVAAGRGDRRLPRRVPAERRRHVTSTPRSTRGASSSATCSTGSTASGAGASRARAIARAAARRSGRGSVPYHNGRACLEVIGRVDALLATGGLARMTAITHSRARLSCSAIAALVGCATTRSPRAPTASVERDGGGPIDPKATPETRALFLNLRRAGARARAVRASGRPRVRLRLGGRAGPLRRARDRRGAIPRCTAGR